MILFEDRASIVLYNVLKTIPQDNFLLPLNICPIVPDTFLKANKKFQFIDISLDTLCMDTNIALNKIKNDSSIGGVLFVKTFGIEFDIEPFYKTIKDLNNNIFIIDDMCPSIQEFDCDINNSNSDLKLFSSGYSKFVDIGYGGYGFVDNSFKSIFEDKQNSKEFIEYKNKVLTEIDLMKKHKNKLNKIYKENINTKYHLGEKWNNWRFSILVDNKDKIIDEIFKIDGLFASSHYPQVDYDYVDKPIQNSNTFKIHSKIINLFNDFRFTEEKAYEICQILDKDIG